MHTINTSKQLGINFHLYFLSNNPYESLGYEQGLKKTTNPMPQHTKYFQGVQNSRGR